MNQYAMIVSKTTIFDTRFSQEIYMLQDLIVVPVYNRESAVIDRIPLLAGLFQDHSVLIIDDGSSDTLSETIQTSEKIHYLKHEKPLGYGGAVISALEYAEAHAKDTLYFIDITNSGFEEALKILQKEMENGFDLANVSRFEEDDVTVDYTSLQPGRIVSHYLRDATGLAYSDFFSPFKAINRSALTKFVLEEFDEALIIQLWIQAVHFGIKTTESFCKECRQSDAPREPFEFDDEYYVNFIKGEVLLYPL